MTDEDLLSLARTIRIGAHRDDIDQLADHSDGMMSAASLVVAPDIRSRNWPWPQKKPCTIRFDRDDRVAFLHFDVGAVQVPGRDPAADLDTLRQRFPGHTDRYQHSFATEGGRVALILGQDDRGAVIVCDFIRGRQTGVSFWSPSELQAEEDKRRAHDLTCRQKQADQAATAAKVLADRAAHAAWRRTAPPDEVLRQWARSQSAWGEKPDAWLRLADWLIADSTPIERHLVMRAYNWDHGVEIPHWIIRQPDTQLATVLTIFWQAEPAFHIDRLARTGAIPALYEAQHDLLLKIGQNIAAGFYKTPWPWQRIGFRFEGRITWNLSDPDVHRAARLLMPDIATQPISGKTSAQLAQARALPFDRAILS